MEEDVIRKKNSILDGNLIASILSIVSIALGITIILDQKQKANKKDGFLTNEESQQLALLAKIIFVFVVTYTLELNYKSYNLSKQTNQDTSSLELQIGASYLSIIVALIGLYVVITDYSNTTFQPAEIENPFI